MIRRIIISIHEHPHGDVPQIHASMEDAKARKIAIARDYWKHAMEGALPEDGETAAERYFGAVEDQGEFFHVHEVDGGSLVLMDRSHWNPDNPWSEHDRYSRGTWAQEASDGDTTLSYVDWVNSQIEMQEYEDEPDEGEPAG